MDPHLNTNISLHKFTTFLLEDKAERGHLICQCPAFLATLTELRCICLRFVSVHLCFVLLLAFVTRSLGLFGGPLLNVFVILVKKQCLCEYLNTN